MKVGQGALPATIYLIQPSNVHCALKLKGCGFGRLMIISDKKCSEEKWCGMHLEMRQFVSPLQDCILWRLPQGALRWQDSVAHSWDVWGNIWLLISDSWYLTPDIWLLMSDPWCLTPDVWLQMSDSWCLTPEVWFLILPSGQDLMSDLFLLWLLMSYFD